MPAPLSHQVNICVHQYLSISGLRSMGLFNGCEVGYSAIMTLDTYTDAVNVSVTDSVATVTLNRPRVHNAWDDSLGAGLERAFTDLCADPEVRAIVLTGTGPT